MGVGFSSWEIPEKNRIRVHPPALLLPLVNPNECGTADIVALEHPYIFILESYELVKKGGSNFGINIVQKHQILTNWIQYECILVYKVAGFI